MNKFATFSAVGLLLGGFAVTSNPAAAQSDSSEKVTVTAPYITNEKQNVMTGAGKNRGAYEVHSTSSEVSYADLDLSKPADADQFLKRIHDEAKADCARIKAQYPEPPHTLVTTDEECARDAAEGPIEIANSLIKNVQIASRTSP